MQKHLSKLLAAAATAALMACGGGGDEVNYADEIDASNMEGAAETSYGFVGDIVDGILNGNPSTDLPELPLAPAFAGGTTKDRLIRGMVARARQRSGHGPELAARVPQLVAMVCDPVVTGVDSLGEPIDTDNDDIPNDVTVSFPANCTNVSGDATFTYSGSLRFRDVAGLYGYRLDMNHFKYREENTVTGEVWQVTINGSENALYTASAANHAAKIGYAYFQHFDDAPAAPGLMAAAPVDFNISFNWDEYANFDPDGTISLEAPMPSGDIAVGLDFKAIASGGDGNFAFHFVLNTPTDLHYDASSCSGIDAGQLRGALNNSDTIYFLITWTGCGSTTYEAHGTTGEAVSTPSFVAR